MACDDGPYIQAACFCDIVIEDKTGVLSLIRLIDTITHTAMDPNPPEVMPPVPFTLKLVLMLKSGEARGRYNLGIRPELPNGSIEEPLLMTVHFDGEEKGQNIIVNLAFVFKFEGLYWFNVFLDDQKLTAIPLRVKYNRIKSGPIPLS